MACDIAFFDFSISDTMDYHLVCDLVCVIVPERVLKCDDIESHGSADCTGGVFGFVSRSYHEKQWFAMSSNF